MKKILLVQAPSPIPKEYRFIPFSLTYIAAVLEQHGYYVEIYDMDVFGYSIEQFLKDYSSFDYDFIGISSHTVSYKNALKLCEISKALNNNTTVVMGGHHVTFMPQQAFIDSSDIDIIVIGEGESTFLEIVDTVKSPNDISILSKIKGIAFSHNNSTIITKARTPEDVNQLPFPARHLLPLSGYSNASIIASRGCPNHCAFCAGPAIHSYRTRNVANIINEIREIMRIDKTFHQERGLVFLDNTFVNPSITQDLCDAIKPFELSWTAESRIDVTSTDILAAMKAAGCIYVQFGIESASDSVLTCINKNISIVDARRKIDFALSLGLIVTCTFSVGHPNESEEDIRKTASFIQELKAKGVVVSTSIVTPYPGTDLWNRRHEYQIEIEDFDWEKYSFFNAVMNTKKLTRRRIQEIFVDILANTKSYISFAESKEV